MIPENQFWQIYDMRCCNNTM